MGKSQLREEWEKREARNRKIEKDDELIREMQHYKFFLIGDSKINPYIVFAQERLDPDQSYIRKSFNVHCDVSVKEITIAAIISIFDELNGNKDAIYFKLKNFKARDLNHGTLAGNDTFHWLARNYLLFNNLEKINGLDS